MKKILIALALFLTGCATLDKNQFANDMNSMDMATMIMASYPQLESCYGMTHDEVWSEMDELWRKNFELMLDNSKWTGTRENAVTIGGGAANGAMRKFVWGHVDTLSDSKPCQKFQETVLAGM